MRKLNHVALFIGFVSIVTTAVCFPAIALSNRSVPAGGKDYYGAIAYSKSTGRFGSAWNAETQEEAERRAVTNCRTTTVISKRQRAEDCQVLLSFRNACGALAKARNGGIAWSEGRTLYEAKLLTSNRCTGDFGSCKLICSVCSRGNEP